MKTALITGGSGGIGSRIVKKLSLSGWQVASVYCNSENRAFRQRLALPGVKVYRCDVSDFARVENLYKEAEESLGHIDLAVNCAGVSGYGLLQEETKENIDRLIDVNLKGVIYSCRRAASLMVKRHSGCIINISSVWGVSGASCEAVYSACKGGVIALTKALAKELAPSGIRVNCISPGVIDTRMISRFSESEIKDLETSTPLGRLGLTEDVASAVEFLSGEDAGFITGQNLVIDGGFIL